MGRISLPASWAIPVVIASMLTIASGASLVISNGAALTGSGRINMAAHANSVGLLIPTKAGAPTAVTGTVEGDLVWDSTGNALYGYDGSAFIDVSAAAAAASATVALDNLASVAINTALLPDAAAADDFGSATLPFKDLWIAGNSGTPATNNFQLTGSSTSGTRVITFPDLTGTVMTSFVEDTTPQLGGDLDLNSLNLDFPTTADISDVKDEDDMASDSATMLATQQSIKAYADAHIFDVSEVNSSVSPAVPFITYIVDASGGDITISLPNTTAGTDGHQFRVVLADSTNNLIVTTVGGTQDVGGQLSQTVIDSDTGITLQANHTSTQYEIIQDSRAKAPTTSITFYGLTEAGAVGGYDGLAVSTQDSDYSQSPSDVSIGPITGADTLLGGWVTDAGVIGGLVTETNLNTIFKLKKSAGSAAAEFYVEYYHRNTGGSETLLGTSGATSAISSASYVQLEVSGIMSAQNFVSTDYFVIKFYGSKIGGGTDPTYDVELEGTTPARAVLPVASSAITHGSLAGLSDDDHTQYLLASGARALAGAWDMGSQVLTNVNIDSGVITGITDLVVADGGTGAGTFTDGGILLGSGTGPFTAMSVLADGSIVVGDNSTDPVALAAFTSSTGDLKHEAGGLEFDASGIQDGGMIVGTGAGTMALRAGFMTAGAAGFVTHELGGLEADVNAYAGLVRIDSGSTSNVTNLAGLNTALGSSIIDGGATAALDNLASVQINLTLISDTDITDNLGSGDVRWKDGWLETLSSGLTATDTLKLRARDVDGSAYVDLFTITSNNTVTGDLNALVTIGGNAILDATSTTSALTTVGTIGTGVWQATDVGVQYGGTGASTLTDHGVLLGSGTGEITPLGEASNGQLVIGSTGADPVVASLTAGDGIDTSVGAGSLTVTAETATDSNPGIAELALAAELNTGTDTGRTVTPDALAGSIHGEKAMILKIFADDTAVTTGDGKLIVMLPAAVVGMNLVDIEIFATTQSSAGTPTVQVRNVTQTADILSTVATIDANEDSSLTAATPPVIDAAQDDYTAGDLIAIDVDVAGTGTKGLGVQLMYKTP